MLKELAVAGLRRSVGAMKSFGARRMPGRKRRFSPLGKKRPPLFGRRHALRKPAVALKHRHVFWGLDPATRLKEMPHRFAGRKLNRAARFAGTYGAPPRPLARRGTLEVRIAETEAEVRAAQRLRYRVFYQEMSAQPSPRMAAERRDFDRYDAFADHLLVIDHSRIPESPTGTRRQRAVPEEAIVGTYRLLRQEVVERRGGFYTANEYDIAPWIAASPAGTRFLELGRSCVAQDQRSRPNLELMWHAIVAYLLHYDLDIMFGCASLEGTNPDELALPLAFMHHFVRGEGEAPEVKALPDLYIDMNRMPKDEIEAKAGLRALPPLIKGYLRAGATIGDGAVIDHQFGTTDVLIVFPAKNINDRYLGKFGKKGSRIGRKADAAE